MLSEASETGSLIVSPSKATRQEAETLFVRLTGRYPTLKIHDPQVFTVEMIRVFSKYPVSICERAIDEVTRDSPNFIPSVALVDKYCWDLMHGTADKTAATFAHQYDARSKMQLDERLAWERRIHQRQANAPYKRGGPGSFANAHCKNAPDTAHIYKKLVARAEKSTDDREFRHDATGIWVPMSWLR